jgi:hypothetical protein
MNGDSWINALSRSASTLDMFMDEGDYDAALDFARSALVAAKTTPGAPDFLEPFTLCNVARVIWNAYDHYLGLYTDANTEPMRSTAESALQKWVALLPEGFQVVKHASLLLPDCEPVEKVLELYLEEAKHVSYIETGIFKPKEALQLDEKIHEEFIHLCNLAQEREQEGHLLEAIAAYDNVINWLHKGGHIGGQNEGIVRYMIAQAINNGFHRRSPINQLVFPLIEVRELLSRGKKEIQAAIEILPNDGAVQKLFSMYEEMEGERPMLFTFETEVGARNESDQVNSSRQSAQSSPSEVRTGRSGCLGGVALFLVHCVLNGIRWQ